MFFSFVEVLALSTSSSASQSLPANGDHCTLGGKDDQCGENKHCEMKGSKALCVCPDTGFVSKGDICEGKLKEQNSDSPQVVRHFGTLPCHPLQNNNSNLKLQN